MKTYRKPICTLVVVLTVVFGHLGVWPGGLQAASPNVDGHWATSRGPAKLHQFGDDVQGHFIGPYGLVHLTGHFDSPSVLRLSVNGVDHDGSATLFVTSGGTRMQGWVNLDGFPPIRWIWWRP